MIRFAHFRYLADDISWLYVWRHLPLPDVLHVVGDHVHQLLAHATEIGRARHIQANLTLQQQRAINQTKMPNADMRLDSFNLENVRYHDFDIQRIEFLYHSS